MKMKCLAAAALALCLAALCACALAAPAPASVSLDVGITLSGSLPRERETFTVRLIAQDGANPMPGGQVGGKYDMGIVGESKQQPNVGRFPAITFDHVGVYTYTLVQLPGGSRDCTYDGRAYTLTVNVLNSADMQRLETVVVCTEAGGGAKTDNNYFHNAYKAVDGNATPTGVADVWPYCLAGCAALTGVSGVLATKLRRREEGEEDAVFSEEDADA